MALHHLCRELVIETYSDRTPITSGHQWWILGRKTTRQTRGLTIHLLLELACLLALLVRLGLQGLDPYAVLTDLHGEPDSHVLGLCL
jgi:hypothetical protein